MANFFPTEQDEADASNKDGLSTWEEIRKLSDELELKIHLASMETRDRWHALEPRLASLERRMKDAGQRASKAIVEELEAMWNALRGIRDGMTN